MLIAAFVTGAVGVLMVGSIVYMMFTNKMDTTREMFIIFVIGILFLGLSLTFSIQHITGKTTEELQMESMDKYRRCMSAFTPEECEVLRFMLNEK